jgi:hypothetical protein
MIYGHDYNAMTIIEPVTKRRVSCGDAEFEAYASISLEDLTKLGALLKTGKFPRHIRILVEEFNKELSGLESNGLDSKQMP